MTTPAIILILLFVVLMYQNYLLTQKIKQLEEKFTKLNTRLLNFEDLLQSKAKKSNKTLIIESE